MGAITGALLGGAGTIYAEGGFGGGAAAAAITLVGHALFGTTVGGLVQVGTDTAAGFAGDKPAIAVGIGATGGVLSRWPLWHEKKSERLLPRAVWRAPGV